MTGVGAFALYLAVKMFSVSGLSTFGVRGPASGAEPWVDGTGKVEPDCIAGRFLLFFYPTTMMKPLSSGSKDGPGEGSTSMSDSASEMEESAEDALGCAESAGEGA